MLSRRRNHVLPHLPRPLPLTFDEVVLGLEDVSAQAEDYVDAKDRFDHAGALAELRSYFVDVTGGVRAAEFDVCDLVGDPPTDDYPDEVWGADHAQITLLAVLREQRRPVAGTTPMDFERPWTLRAEIRGYFSKDAAAPARAEASRVLRALLRLRSDLDAVDERPIDPAQLTRIPADRLPDMLVLVQKWLGSFYGTKPDRKSLDKRVLNAIELIVEADHQHRDAIALPLLCAAMEALVARGSQGVTETLAEAGATLLEPDAPARVHAVKFIKGLYGARSRVIHGDTLEVEPRSRNHARTLCAHLLQAVVDWRDFQQRCNGNTDADTFLDELQQARLTGKSLITARESLIIRRLWQAARRDGNAGEQAKPAQ